APPGGVGPSAALRWHLAEASSASLPQAALAVGTATGAQRRGPGRDRAGRGRWRIRPQGRCRRRGDRGREGLLSLPALLVGRRLVGAGLGAVPATAGA